MSGRVSEFSRFDIPMSSIHQPRHFLSYERFVLVNQ